LSEEARDVIGESESVGEFKDKLREETIGKEKFEKK